MSINNESAGTKASYAVHMLVRLTAAPHFKDALQGAYGRALQLACTTAPVPPHESTPDDIERIHLESLSFAAFLVTIAIGNHACNHPAADPFIKPLIGMLRAEIMGFHYAVETSGLREIISESVVPGIEYKVGEPLSIAKRVSEYLKLYGPTAHPSALRFVGRLAPLIDPRESRENKIAASGAATWAADHLITVAEQISASLVTEEDAAMVERLLSKKK